MFNWLTTFEGIRRDIVRASGVSYEFAAPPAARYCDPSGLAVTQQVLKNKRNAADSTEPLPY